MIGKAVWLTSLKLQGSYNLSGLIPSEIGTLVSLTTLQLERNNLSGIIPDKLGKLTPLELLHLDRNTNLKDMIPSSIDLLILHFLSENHSLILSLNVDCNNIQCNHSQDYPGNECSSVLNRFNN